MVRVHSGILHRLPASPETVVYTLFTFTMTYAHPLILRTLLSTSLLALALILCCIQVGRHNQGPVVLVDGAVQDTPGLGWLFMPAHQVHPRIRDVAPAVEVTQTSSSKRSSFHRGRTWRQQTVIEEGEGKAQ